MLPSTPNTRRQRPRTGLSVCLILGAKDLVDQSLAPDTFGFESRAPWQTQRHINRFGSFPTWLPLAKRKPDVPDGMTVK